MVFEHRRSDEVPLLAIVITDGADNSSTHTLTQTIDIVKGQKNACLCIVNIGAEARNDYSILAGVTGKYYEVDNEIIADKVSAIVDEFYKTR